MRLRTLFSLPDTAFTCTGMIPREYVPGEEEDIGFTTLTPVTIRLCDIIEDSIDTTVIVSWYPANHLERMELIAFTYRSYQTRNIEDVEDVIKRKDFTEQRKLILTWLLRKLKDSINTRVEEQISNCKFENIKRDLINNKVSLVEKKKKPAKKQKTYIIFDKYSNCYKLGKSTNPKKRKGTLLSDRTSLELVAIADKDVETILHRKYKNQRVDGEWFKLSKEEVFDIINTYNFKQVSL